MTTPSPLYGHTARAAALNAKGCALCEQAQFGPALDTFDPVLARDRTYYTAWNNRANALGGLNRQAEALAAYAPAVALNPQYSWFQATYPLGTAAGTRGARTKCQPSTVAITS